MANQLIPEILLERVAQRFKILSEPVRLQLLNHLMAGGEMSVNELVDELHQQQPNISKHLNLMAREGILRRRKAGLQVFYQISDPSIHGLCILVCGRLRDEASINPALADDHPR